MSLTTRKQALDYHAHGRPGKVEVVSTKPCLTQIDLSLAYTPGVAEPCREIHEDPDRVYDYTARGNLVAVVSDGTAVLGLGDIGPLAAKPVMEGKGVLFKRFADIDVFDLELATKDVDEIVAAVRAIAPSVAGINLEDISAPRCFEVERRLRECLDIPVFHDDQHGTALIAGAALLNASELAGKRLGELRIVVCGAGASAIACADYFQRLGADPARMILCDSAGVIFRGRKERMNPWKERFAADTDARRLDEALVDADVFLGLSAGGLLTPAMMAGMAPNPIVLALANPDPEIGWEDAIAARPDVIMATGRSDYPNQVNNVLGFPFVFRGALDVRATCINDEMMLAATRALAELAREPVPADVAHAYGLDSLEFGRHYFIPKPLDRRVLGRVAAAVAEAAVRSGVARRPIPQDSYRRVLEERRGSEQDLMDRIVARARKMKRRIVFADGLDDRVLLAANDVAREGIATPLLVGPERSVRAKAEEHHLPLDLVEIIDPKTWPTFDRYAVELYEVLHDERHSLEEMRRRAAMPAWFAPLMVRLGEADGMVGVAPAKVRRKLEPLFRVIPLQSGVSRACGLSMVFDSDGVLFLADTAMNIDPSDAELAEIALLAAAEVRRFGIEPTVAMLSFASYGASDDPRCAKVRRAVEFARAVDPQLRIDGEMRLDVALSPRVQGGHPNCTLGGKRANVLVFPSLEAADTGLNLLRHLGDKPVVGPVILGLSRPAQLLQPDSASSADLVHLTAVACLEASPFPVET
jgi:malate dehydrogenase (oxaloacetate-decarboxylating)(NADP+)